MAIQKMCKSIDFEIYVRFWVTCINFNHFTIIRVFIANFNIRFNFRISNYEKSDFYNCELDLVGNWEVKSDFSHYI